MDGWIDGGTGCGFVEEKETSSGGREKRESHGENDRGRRTGRGRWSEAGQGREREGGGPLRGPVAVPDSTPYSPSPSLFSVGWCSAVLIGAGRDGGEGRGGREMGVRGRQAVERSEASLNGRARRRRVEGKEGRKGFKVGLRGGAAWLGRGVFSGTAPRCGRIVTYKLVVVIEACFNGRFDIVNEIPMPVCE